jgi:hypothetical protein
MTEYDYYYFSPSVTGTSGLNAIGSALVEEAKEEHSFVVYGKDAIPNILECLKKRAKGLRDEKPRCKLPNIWVTFNDYTGNGTLHIDTWSFLLYKVKSIIHF